MTDQATPAKVRLTDGLGPAVPDSVLAYLYAYGDSRADNDGLSGLRNGEAILALRRWAAELQGAERERARSVIEAFPHWLGPQAKRELLVSLYGPNVELTGKAGTPGLSG